MAIFYLFYVSEPHLWELVHDYEHNSQNFDY